MKIARLSSGNIISTDMDYIANMGVCHRAKDCGIHVYVQFATTLATTIANVKICAIKYSPEYFNCLFCEPHSQQTRLNVLKPTKCS